jgi:hypothetical protein
MAVVAVSAFVAGIVEVMVSTNFILDASESSPDYTELLRQASSARNFSTSEGTKGLRETYIHKLVLLTTCDMDCLREN